MPLKKGQEIIVKNHEKYFIKPGSKGIITHIRKNKYDIKLLKRNLSIIVDKKDVIQTENKTLDARYAGQSSLAVILDPNPYDLDSPEVLDVTLPDNWYDTSVCGHPNKPWALTMYYEGNAKTIKEAEISLYKMYSNYKIKIPYILFISSTILNVC